MRCLSLILILLMVWTSTSSGIEHSEHETLTIDELQRRYPQAQFYFLSMAEFRLIASHFDGELEQHFERICPGGMVVSSFKLQEEKSEPEEEPEEESAKPADKDKSEQDSKETSESEPAPKDKEKSEQEAAEKQKSSPSAPDFGDVSGCFDLNLGDGAGIAFVIIGVFVVVVFVVFAGKYLYHILTNYKKYDHWWELNLAATSLGGREIEGLQERGTLKGFKFATGFVDRNVHIGLAGELGNLDLSLHLRDHDQLYELDGIYGVIGPAVRVYFDEKTHHVYLYLELLTGTTEPREIKLISLARLGLNFGFTEHIRVGLNVGSFYIDLRETEGLFRRDSDFSYIGGFDVGFRF
ncbi:hypothetical protein ACFL27_00295 [candidate division CSSED10-310 bacterium]|uniref:Outer membrane protein beta-barrel domain-containing protein n=1 Tax=candidate division CSSED10-310 bacterium TaxID=2855610 RepID=A0ABV6YQY9_UNCC1